MAERLTQNIKLPDGTLIDATALIYMLLSEKGNVELTSPKNINLEAVKSIKFKPGNGAQVEFIADHTGDVSEILLKALVAVDENGNPISEIPIRFKFNCTEVEYNTKGSSNVDSFEIKAKTGRKTGDTYAQMKIKGRSIDIRCVEHGGVALQPNGHDGSGHENKIKFESNRTSNIGETATYQGSGGDGMEFGTFNNEHTSLFCGDYRFKGDAPIFGVTRGELVEDPTTKKIDYPTQADDFKDIIDPNNSATWNEIIAAAKKKEWYGTQDEFDDLQSSYGLEENVNYFIYD